MEKFFINLFPVLVYASSGSDPAFHSHIHLRINTLVTGCHLLFQYLIFRKWSGKPDKRLYGFPDKMINMEELSDHCFIFKDNALMFFELDKQTKEANGLNLKEMNLLLLKKVEEMTLHLIEVKKKRSSSVTKR